jgi:hypothetical protein
MDFLKAQLARARLPPVEQKVFDATNGDAWGPHGTVLGEVARCTASPDERAQVLSVLWRRVAEDKPDQWRCVYKALAVLEYLVANGSEAVVDELCNSTRRLAGLSGFQYKDNDGKDQVRGAQLARARPGAAAQARLRCKSCSLRADLAAAVACAGHQRSAQERHAHGGRPLGRTRHAWLARRLTLLPPCRPHRTATASGR